MTHNLRQSPHPVDLESCNALIQELNDLRTIFSKTLSQTGVNGRDLVICTEQTALTIDPNGSERVLNSAARSIWNVRRGLELLEDKRTQLETLSESKLARLYAFARLLQLDDEVGKVLLWFEQEGESYFTLNNKLADSAESSYKMLEAHMKFMQSASSIRETVNRLIETAEPVLQQAPTGAETENVRHRLRIMDDACQHFMNRLLDRQKHLQDAAEFYANANSSFEQLDYLETILNELISSRDEPEIEIVDKLFQLAKTVVETSEPVIQQGRQVAENSESVLMQSENVRTAVDTLESRRDQLTDICRSLLHELKEKHNKEAIAYKEIFDEVQTTVTQIEETILRRYADPGTNSGEVSNYVDRLKQLAAELEEKNRQLEELRRRADELANLSNDEKNRLNERLRAMDEQLARFEAMIRRRIDLMMKYSDLLSDGSKISRQLKSVEESLRQQLSQEHVNPEAKPVLEEVVSTSKNAVVEWSDRARNFLTQVQQANDPDLKVQTVYRVVNDTGTSLNDECKWLEDLLRSFLNKMDEMSQLEQEWNRTVEYFKELLKMVANLEQKFFPFSLETASAQRDPIKFCQANLEQFLPNEQRTQGEIDKLIQQAEIVGARLVNPEAKYRVVTELNNVKKHLTARTNEFQVLLNMATMLFKNLGQLDSVVDRANEQLRMHPTPATVEEAETMLRDHAHNRENVMELFGFASNEANHLMKRVHSNVSFQKWFCTSHENVILFFSSPLLPKLFVMQKLCLTWLIKSEMPGLKHGKHKRSSLKKPYEHVNTKPT